MGQGYSLTTLSAGSAGIDVPELADLSYEKALSGARFMKSVRARQQHSLVYVKAIMKPYPSMDLSSYVRAIQRERTALAEVTNALGYERVLETSTGGYLVRQYLHSSVYDRMSTRPFLEDIEKRWLSYQLLCALRDCHARDIFHGDIKTENLIVTSWNWLYLTDFSSSFKPTYLPEDNPAEFDFYFDISGRRTCYLAPERFTSAGEQPDDRAGVNWAMDIFSAGCVIAELFLEGPIFTLSSMFRYQKGDSTWVQTHVNKIEDTDIRELVLHMINVEPESRYSADEYLNFWRRRAFPEYFYSFLHQYMGLITDPSAGRASINSEGVSLGEADERIDRIYLDFDKISYFLGYSNRANGWDAGIPPSGLTTRILPVHLNLPASSNQLSKVQSQADDGTVIFLTLVVSSLRNTAKATARIRACDLLLAFAERLPDEARLDRVLPYLITLLSDRSDAVRVAAIRSLTQLLAMVRVVSPVNAYVFPEYIFPRLSAFVPGHSSNPSPLIRATYASCLSSLALSSLRILDMIQAIRADGRLHAVSVTAGEDDWATESTYHNLFDVARVDIVDHFEAHTKALLTDADPSVRRAFLGSVASLCVFFGSSKANEIILSHLNTYLNDKDWILKCCFFETVVGVATYVGSTSLEEFILPLMIQSLTDAEDFVVERVLRSLASMAELGLFERGILWEMLGIIVRFLVHPCLWIREAAVQFLVAPSRYLSTADKQCVVMPMLQPFLQTEITTVSLVQILDALRKPLSKIVFDMALVWATKAEKSLFWKAASRDGVFSLSEPNAVGSSLSLQQRIATTISPSQQNEEDSQWLTRLRNLGMSREDELKLMALRELIWRLAARNTKEEKSADSPPLDVIIPLNQVNVTPQTVFFDKQPVIKDQREESSKTATEIDKSHTIADALLDASSTIYDPTTRRRTTTDDVVDGNGTPASLPRSITFTGRHNPRHISSPVSTSPGGPSDASGQIREPDLVSLLRVGSTSSPLNDRDIPRSETERFRDRQASEQSIQRRSSAINLLNKRDTTKADAATSTDSTNAFGKVDGPVQPKAADHPSSLSMARDDESETGPMPIQSLKPTFQANHSYQGSDPTILRLLETIYTENFPTDLFEFGPQVTPISPRQAMRRPSPTVTDPSRPWRPEGTLVIMFGEHSAAINRVCVAPDHTFFITASDDSTVKIWDTTRLEKNLTPRSRQTHFHDPGVKVKALTFVENTHTFLSGGDDGSLHAVKVDYHLVSPDTSRYGKLTILRSYQLPPGEHAVWLEHFRSEHASTLLILTNFSRLLALDLKTMRTLYAFSNPSHHGVATTFYVDRKSHWLLIGTEHGILDLWDLRFRIRLKAFGLPGSTPIHRITSHPLKDRGKTVCVSGGCANGELTVWDIEKQVCRDVYRTNPRSLTPGSYDAWKVDDDAHPESMLARFATRPSISVSSSGESRSTIRAVAAMVDMPGPGNPKTISENARAAFFITGGSDRKVRFWDISHPDASMVISGLDVPEVGGKPRYDSAWLNSNTTVTTEWMPNSPASEEAIAKTRNQTGKRTPKSEGGKEQRERGSVTSSDKATSNQDSGKQKKSGGGTSRTSVISLAQQRLLMSHLDGITDVAVLLSPYGMVVSVDRAGGVYVFQ